MTDTASSKPRNSRATLLILVVIFAAPILAAWFLYLNPQYLPAGRKNHGQLVQPPRPFPELGQHDVAGQPFDLTAFHEMWTLVLYTQLPCSDECAKRWYDLGQIHKALGENQFRVKHVLLAAAPDEIPSGLEEQLGGAKAILFPPAEAEKLGTAFDAAPQAAINNVFIVDPMGNVMMRYTLDKTAKDILKDMELLLRASQNWVKGAQYGHK